MSFRTRPLGLSLYMNRKNELSESGGCSQLLSPADKREFVTNGSISLLRGTMAEILFPRADTRRTERNKITLYSSRAEESGRMLSVPGPNLFFWVPERTLLLTGVVATRHGMSQKDDC